MLDEYNTPEAAKAINTVWRDVATRGLSYMVAAIFSREGHCNERTVHLAVIYTELKYYTESMSVHCRQVE